MSSLQNVGHSNDLAGRHSKPEPAGVVHDLPSSRYEAGIYSLTRWGVIGWAWMPSRSNQAVQVEAVLDGNVIGRAVATDMRPDIAAIGRGNGRCGFSIAFHGQIAGDKPPSLHLRADDTVAILPDCRWSLFEGHVDELTARGAAGWVWVPSAPKNAVTVQAIVSGHVVGRAVADQVRLDICASGRGDGRCGFVLAFERPLARDEFVVFKAVAMGASTILPSAEWSEIVGYVDHLTRYRAVGWAWRPETPDEALLVEAVIDGEVVGCATANSYLKHLASTGRGTGRYGFDMEFDHRLTGDTAPVIRVIRPGGAIVLPSPHQMEPDESRGDSAHAHHIPMDDAPIQPTDVEGAVDFLSRRSATGWAWQPSAPGLAVAVEATVEGRVVGNAKADQPRDDLVYWGKGTGSYGFTLIFDEQLSGDSLPEFRVRGSSRLVILPGVGAFANDDDVTATAPYEGGNASKPGEANPIVLGAVEGSVDYLTQTGATGWAWLPSSPDTTLTVEALLHGAVLGRALACHLREDLAHWGKGSGRYGFSLSFDEPLLDEQPPTFQVVGPAGPELLPTPAMARSELQAERTSTAAQPHSLQLPPGVEGHVDRLTRWEASGWVWDPLNPGATVEIRAILDGAMIGHALANELRQDLADWGKGTGRYGFHIAFDVPITGDHSPVLQPYIPSPNVLQGNTTLEIVGRAELSARRRGTVETLMLEHNTFTSPGPHFEEFDPTILADCLGPKPNVEPWLIAFYLPQFHAIPENDRFWGNGFTEWRQLPRAISRFPGHYQPRIPRDLGFYNLLETEALKRQYEMAKAAGITAFAYYYYWFNQTRVLEKPLEALLASDLDVPFMLIWANENWTRAWDGSTSSVLLQQNYQESDDLPLVADLARHFSDPRYLRIDGRPLFVIYNPGAIPNTAKTIRRWRRLLRARHDLNPLIFMAQTFGQQDPRPLGLDGAIEFPPHKLTDNLPGRRMPDAYSETFVGRVIDYEDFAITSLEEQVPAFPLVKTVVPSWDNEARRPNRGLTLDGISPAKYESWLRALIQKAMRRPIFNRPIVAINAWNEWAEGAYLEPDVYFGAAFLNATARARVAALVYKSTTAPTNLPVNRPRVSAVLPNYNHSAFIVERIKSVLNQTVQPDEIIFLDDCSSDNSVELARQTLEEGGIPFQIIESDTNSGVFRQWTKGITLAQHELIWIAETDDSAHPDFLLHILPKFEREDVSAAFGRIRFINAAGDLSPDLDSYFDDLRDFCWQRSVTVPAFRAFTHDFAIKNVIPNASGLVFRKPKLSALEAERLYGYQFAGDWYLYSLLLRGGSLAYCRAAESYFRVTRDSASRSAFFTDRHLQEHRMIVQDLWYEYGLPDTAIAAHAVALARHLRDQAPEEIRHLLTTQLSLNGRERPMRICVAADSFNVGGGEVLPLDLANELKRLGHHITYLVIERSRGRQDGTVRNRLRADIPTVYWDDVKTDFLSFLSDYGIQVFNSHNVSIDYRVALKAQKISIPYVVSLHGGYETVPELLTDDVVSFLQATVSKWVYLSDKNLVPLRDRGLPNDAFQHSFNAVPEFAGEWVDRCRFREAHSIPSDAFVLVLCSRAIKEKGWKLAVEITNAVAEASGRDVRIVLIGEGAVAQELRSSPADQVRNVILLGNVDYPIRYFRCFDAGIFPSTFGGETFPLFLLECFSAGLPVVSTDVGEIRNIMGKDVSQRPGAIVPHNRGRGHIATSMVRQLVRIVKNQKLYGRMCRNARATSAHFSMEQLGSAYENTFRLLIQGQADDSKCWVEDV